MHIVIKVEILKYYSSPRPTNCYCTRSYVTCARAGSERRQHAVLAAGAEGSSSSTAGAGPAGGRGRPGIWTPQPRALRLIFLGGGGGLPLGHDLPVHALAGLLLEPLRVLRSALRGRPRVRPGGGEVRPMAERRPARLPHLGLLPANQLCSARPGLTE